MNPYSIAKRADALKAAIDAVELPIDWYTARACARIAAEYFLGTNVSAESAEADAIRSMKREFRIVRGELDGAERE